MCPLCAYVPMWLNAVIPNSKKMTTFVVGMFFYCAIPKSGVFWLNS